MTEQTADQMLTNFQAAEDEKHAASARAWQRVSDMLKAWRLARNKRRWTRKVFAKAAAAGQRFKRVPKHQAGKRARKLMRGKR